MSEFREGIGLPPLRLSERGRQAAAFISAVLGLAAGQLALLVALAPLADLEPSLQVGRPAPVDPAPLLAYWPNGVTAAFAGGATVLPVGSAVIERAAIGGAAAGGSALGVVFAALSRTHHRDRRRCAMLAGYLYLLSDIIASALVAARAARGPQLPSDAADLERGYHAAFANAMWDYLYDPRLKMYIDTVQQELGCCGAGGFTDWYLTDWLRPGVYKQRYYMNLLGRLRLGLKPNESYYSLANYGSILAQKALVAQLGNAELTSSKQTDLFFNEVPFSCCNPESPIFCRQQFAGRVMFAYDPADNLTVFDRGCARALAEAVGEDARETVAPLWWLFGVKLAALALYRLVQTSQACALAAGRHLSPARGWVIPLWPSRGGGGEADPEKQALVDGGESEGETPASGESEGETTGDGSEDTGETAGDGESGAGETEDTEETDNIPPPPPMDD